MVVVLSKLKRLRSAVGIFLAVATVPWFTHDISNTDFLNKLGFPELLSGPYYMAIMIMVYLYQPAEN